MLNNIYYFLTGLLSFKFRSNLKRKFVSYVAANNLDKKIENFINYKNGFYVELGANDGINQSNTFYFEKKKNWKGILIEPFENNYKECKRNRSKKNKFFNAACVANKNQKKIKLFYANLLTTSNLNKKNIKKIEKDKLHLDKKIKSKYFYANAKTLNQILILAKSPKIIDLLSLDVEGSELNVLKGINFNNYVFKFMLIECNEYRKIIKFLKTKNYILESYLGGKDYLFKYDFSIKA